jgi:hypothetical protein
MIIFAPSGRKREKISMFKFSKIDKEDRFYIVIVALIIILTIFAIISIFPKTTANTYDISAFYKQNDENFCVYVPTDDGGTEVIVFPIDKTIIYSAKDDREYIEVTTFSGYGTENAIAQVKVYISKSLDEVGYM